MDPEFDAAVREAVAEAKQKLRWAPDQVRGTRGSNEPPSGWGHLDGVELVVRGSSARRVQIARARVGQISAAVEDRFLATLAATCNVKAAYLEAGVSKGAIYSHRRRWPAFAQRWDEAVEEGGLMLELALIGHARNPFARRELPPAVPTPPMSADDCFHNLYMHKRRLTGLGGQPGRRGRPPDIAEVTAKIVRIADAITRGRGVDAAARARSERELARRGDMMRAAGAGRPGDKRSG
jgi:hypothetical protein